ncbi:DUF2339 domain-containing protein [Rossellomorea aquimaris]|uniref:DUF2339 domain-containing protein n=1 Tax=Rossellomorea aquimaris TaxID=189382 RepID=UPI001CD7B6F0|nr:DUF2339 domain-containing protein [Rossellomorea aquimaris]MCA1055984.1 DUF2339 domain-containing protein [Rossellomorea aquimaris]
MEREELERLERRIDSLEKELNSVKIQLMKAKHSSLDTLNPNQNDMIHTKQQQSVPQEEPEEVKSPKPAFDFSVERWLPKVFLFVLLIGSVWGFMAASQNGWLAPGFRVLIGAVVSIVMYFLGERYIRDQRRLGLTLLSGSIVLAIITLFSANILYGFIPGVVTNVLLLLIISAGLWVSHKHGSQLILCLIGVGAYLFPFIFAGDARSEWLFYGYQLLMFFVLVTFSTWKRYRVAWNIHYYLLYFTLFFFAAFGVGQITLTILIPFAIQHAYILLLIALNRDERVSAEMIPAVVSGSFILLGLLSSVYVGIPLFYYIIFAVVYIGISFLEPAEKKHTKDVLLVLGFLYVLLFIFSWIDYDWAAIIVALQATALLWLAGRRRSKIGLAGSFILILYSLLGAGLGPSYDFLTVELPVFLIAFCYLYLLGHIRITGKVFTRIPSILIKSVLTAVMFSFVMRATDYIVIGWDYTPSTTAFTVAIAVLSIGYLVYGESRKDAFYRWVGIGFLALALVKFFFSDLVFLDFTIRAMILIPIGVIGLVLSRILYKKR